MTNSVWRFDVVHEHGHGRDAPPYWNWEIFDIDDRVVLDGNGHPEDPTPLLKHIVQLHNAEVVR